ncbi:MAG: DJ-1/PfpI family protein [Bacteroidales bacterium OttesenSCG-928-I14]|jgi:4-methyl-5(b-hydroxyethyl)-thiazole monophosphate biosynthesis|nr:DJ-1/PfpI family protein [Bacteroidales bacterium OttesenSCG-928-I14]
MQIFVFLADGFEEIEAISVIDILRRGELNVITVSVTSKSVVIGSHGIAVVADRLFDETDFSHGEMLVLPGGLPGINNLNAHEKLKKLLKQYDSKGRKIAAICAAPSILGELNLLHSKKATVYPGFENKLFGAIYVKNIVLKDGNIITGSGPAHAFEFALFIVSELNGSEKAKKIAESMLLK